MGNIINNELSSESEDDFILGRADLKYIDQKSYDNNVTNECDPIADSELCLFKPEIKYINVFNGIKDEPLLTQSEFEGEGQDSSTSKVISGFSVKKENFDSDDEIHIKKEEEDDRCAAYQPKKMIILIDEISIRKRKKRTKKDVDYKHKMDVSKNEASLNGNDQNEYNPRKRKKTSRHNKIKQHEYVKVKKKRK